jgi:hypothetical protein
MSNLGRLNKIELRNQWKDEARDFTPWLATEENLQELSNAIGIDLELDDTEVYVGSFKADIVARDINSDRKVIIENQLEKTNHDHLGKTITYASGLDASVIIWIASKIRDEHQQAVDWLNENTTEDFGFFAVEMELWKIGDSLPAPKFNVVSRPNDWAKSVKQYTKDHSHSTTKTQQLEFWTSLYEYFDEVGSPLSLRSPNPRHWYSLSVGRSKFNISMTINTRDKRLGVEIYIRGENAKKAFGLLEKDKEGIESDLGVELNWQLLPEGQDCRIILYKDGDLFEKNQWQSYREWFKQWTEKFFSVFSPRIKRLEY